VVACGTAFHAGLLAKYLFERWAALPVEIEIASEFRYRNLVVTDEDLVVAISQSGETMDTLAGVREATRRGARVIAIVNTVGSQMTREASGVILTHAGPEIGVAATKTFTAQIPGQTARCPARRALRPQRRRPQVDAGEDAAGPGFDRRRHRMRAQVPLPR
jgi:glucosamine--fructose-6-phosphate aminotransferase (isomerizing)